MYIPRYYKEATQNYSNMDSLPTIPDFYRDRKIFITGGSGFMGKALIEKLLRSCPDLHTIYLLLRPKKGKQPESRIQDITRDALFDSIREANPGALDKLRAIAGDVKKLGLALSVEDRDTLQKEVSVVFHSAATVRFTEPVKDAVLMNVRGTREVVNLALGMANLKAFQHVSTAFSNCNHGRVAEKMYPPPAGWDWNKVIKLAETDGVDAYINVFTPKILGALIQNTYIFTKALAEQLINDHRDRLPVVIVRPSVVILAFDEPLKGWVDNLNGPHGLWVGVYTGVVRTVYFESSVALDMVPVDVAVKSMIYIAWHRALSGPSADTEVPVYNCSGMLSAKTQGEFMKEVRQVIREFPTAKMIRYQDGELTSSWTYYYVSLLLAVAYGALLDAILKCKNMQPMFVKIYRRLYTTSKEIKIFSEIEYTFEHVEFLRVADCMLPEDRKAFGYTKVRNLDLDAMKTILFGLRKYLLHDPIETMPAARRNMARLYWLEVVVKGTFCLALLWALFATGAVQLAFHACSPRFVHKLQ